MATISCLDCGAERTRCPRNTRYCKPCGLLRALDYWRHRVRRCRECRTSFAPLARNDYHCSVCDPGLRHRPIACVLCRQERPSALTGIPVCATCLREPGPRRKDLIEALELGQSNRKVDRVSA